MTTIHTVTDPNGTTHNRTSANRVYTHAVLVRESYEHAMEIAKQLYEIDGDNWAYDVRKVRNNDHYSWETPEQIERQKARAQAYTSRQEAMEGAARERVTRVCEKYKAGGFDTWSVLGWNGRLDLAQKAASTAGPRFAEVKIVETTRTTKAKRGQ